MKIVKKKSCRKKTAKKKGLHRAKNKKVNLFVAKKNYNLRKNTKLPRVKNYSEDDVQRAVQAISVGISYRTAAKTFKVSLSTLFRKNNEHEKSRSKPGPIPVLSELEEQKIVDWVILRAQNGYPVCKSQLLDSVQLYLITSKKRIHLQITDPDSIGMRDF